MSATLTALERKETVRLGILKSVYERTDGNPEVSADVRDMLVGSAPASSEGQIAIQYLLAEGLLLDRDEHRISITHAGVKEFEAAIRTVGPAGTEHFSRAAIVRVLLDDSLQTSDPGDVPVRDTVPNEPSDDLSSLLTQLHNHASELPERDREVALEHVVRLQRAASSENPDTIRMKVWLKGLEAFAPLIPVVGRVLDALSDIGV
jgi:hypothetical protein